MTTSPLASAAATRELLEAFGLATKHRLGQNFLIDNHVIEHICALAELRPEERVLEVGPGIGTLTLALLQEAGKVVSIEADPELEQVLWSHSVEHPNFAFIMGDALKVDLGAVGLPVPVNHVAQLDTVDMRDEHPRFKTFTCSRAIRLYLNYRCTLPRISLSARFILEEGT